MAFFLYASFPNSRIKPRSPTQTATTFHVLLTGLANNSVIALADPNRTYLRLTNSDPAITMFYTYGTIVTVNPTVTPTFGNVGDIVRSSLTSLIYQKNDAGTTTNWTAKLINTLGVGIPPLQTFALDAINDAVFASAAGGVLDVDYGQG